MTGEVVVADDAERFATMLGGLIRANVQADPDRASAVASAEGVVAVELSDVAETVWLRFGQGRLEVGSTAPADRPAIRIVGTADAIMGLSTTPLRFGLPDLLSGGGRSVAGRWLTSAVRGLGAPTDRLGLEDGSDLQVHGLPMGAPLLRTVLTLLSVVR